MSETVKGGIFRAENMNGEVRVWNIKKPMRLETFESMPVDLQQEYFKKLRVNLGFGPQLVADMLGTDKNAVISRAKALGLDWSKARLNTKNEEIMARREAFLSGYEFPKKPAAVKQAAEEPEEPKQETGAATAEKTDARSVAKLGEYLAAGLQAGLRDAEEKPAIDWTLDMQDILAGLQADIEKLKQTKGQPDAPAVSAEMISFRVELSGAMEGVLERLQAFAAVFGSRPVKVTVKAGGRE